MLEIVAATSIVVLLAAVLLKRNRDRAELERHSIAPEELHNLLASNKNVALFDVRLPLDLLANSIVIPGAVRVAPEDLIANPSLMPRDQDLIVYCTCPGDKTSRAVLRRALALDFLRVRFLRGGLEAWKSRGFPVEPYDKSFHLTTSKGRAAVAG